MRTWERKTAYSITCDGWAICKVSGVSDSAYWLYAPRDNDYLPNLRGKFETLDQAKAEFERRNPLPSDM